MERSPANWIADHICFSELPGFPPKRCSFSLRPERGWAVFNEQTLARLETYLNRLRFLLVQHPFAQAVQGAFLCLFITVQLKPGSPVYAVALTAPAKNRNRKSNFFSRLVAARNQQRRCAEQFQLLLAEMRGYVTGINQDAGAHSRVLLNAVPAENIP